MTKAQKRVVEILPPKKRKSINHPWVAKNWRHREYLAARKRKVKR